MTDVLYAAFVGDVYFRAYTTERAAKAQATRLARHGHWYYDDVGRLCQAHGAGRVVRFLRIEEGGTLCL